MFLYELETENMRKVNEQEQANITTTKTPLEQDQSTKQRSNIENMQNMIYTGCFTMYL